MSILIAVSGTQSVGKTTLLNDLSDKFIVDTFKASRAVQEELGVDKLSDAVLNPNKIMNFQERIFEVKLEHDTELLNADNDNKILVERSFFDIIVYANLWLKKYPKDRNLKEWFKDFKLRCIEAQSIYNGLIMLNIHKDIPYDIDPNRAGNDSRQEVENELQDLIKIYWPTIVRPGNRNYGALLNLYSPDKAIRFQEVSNFLNSLHIA